MSDDLHVPPKYKGLNPIRRLSHCSCHKLTPRPAHLDNDSGWHEPGWFERLLKKVIPHVDIIKAVECHDCLGAGIELAITCQDLSTGETTHPTCRTCEGTGSTVVTYLRRFYLWRSKWIGKNRGDIYLHHIVRSDDDPDPHTHPWSFTGLVLAGGYRDERWRWVEAGEWAWEDPDGQPRMNVQFPQMRGRFHEKPFRLGPVFELVFPGQVISRSASHTHRVRLYPRSTAWTLIFTSGYGREWFFITKDGPVAWRQYLNVPQGTDTGL